MKSDLEYYAQQIRQSSMAEVYTTGIETRYYYENYEAKESGLEGTDVYQKFRDIRCSIETNPAKNDEYPESDADKVEKNDAGEIIANDKVLYTDLYYYVPVDGINPNLPKAHPEDEGYVTGLDQNMLYFDIGWTINAKYSDMKYYKSNADYDLIRPNLTDSMKDLWLKSYNLDDQLADTTKWSDSPSDWCIVVPYNMDDTSNFGTIYTKVYGVMTAEDGVHKNIIRVNVILDTYRPSAKLKYVRLDNAVKSNKNETDDYNTQSLYSTYDGSFTTGYYTVASKGNELRQKYKLQSGEGNKGLYPSTGRSMTDKYSTPVTGHELGDYKDIPYFYLTDDIVSTGGQTVDNTADGFHNIEYYNTGQKITLEISTENLNYNTTHYSIWAEISYQDRVPNKEYDDYNNWWEDDAKTTENPHVTWNDKGQTAANEKPTQGTYLKKVEYESSDNIDNGSTGKTVGHTTITFDSSYMPTDQYYHSSKTAGVYYGGLYRIDLYHERTRDAGEVTKKHFATVFFYKQHSPENTQSYGANNWYYGNGNGYYSSSVIRDNWKEGNQQLTYSGYLQKYYSSDYLKSQFKDYSYMTLFKNTENSNNNQNYMLPFIDRSLSSGIYAKKAYVANRVLSGGTTSPASYLCNADSPFSDNVFLLNLKMSMDRLDVVAENWEGVDAFYPASYHWYSDIYAEDLQHIRKADYELVSNGSYKNHNTVGTHQNPPAITISSATIENGGITPTNGEMIGVIKGNVARELTFNCQWTGNNVYLFNNASRPSTISGNELFNNDGYSVKHLRIFYRSLTSTDYTDITDQVLDANGELVINDTVYNENKYFTSISVNDNNLWTFKLNEFAPVGMYKIIPYMVYSMDLRTVTDRTEGVQLYGYRENPDEETPLTDATVLNAVKTDIKDVYRWQIPYTPFYIDNQPNDDSYLLEYDANNDEEAPYLIENHTVTVAGSDNREIFILPSSENQEITYKGYLNYRLSNATERIDKFDIYTYVPKTTVQSNLRIKLPYRATLEEWTGTGSPILDDGTILSANWTSVTSETAVSNRSYKEYEDTVSYGITGTTKYYRVIAEDGTTATVYKVTILPGNRNKKTSLEIAQNPDELSPVIKTELTPIFQSSKGVYQEIISRYGQFNATIKELKENNLEYYESKWFTGSEQTDTQPNIYNLKARKYDISVDLPAGYTYDIYLLSVDKDGYQMLQESKDGFSGSRLMLINPEDQTLNLRIVLKRKSGDLWGVNYLWNPDSSKFTTRADDKKYVKTYGGGVFNNFVYDTRE